jgi:hypothetical protein
MRDSLKVRPRPLLSQGVGILGCKTNALPANADSSIRSNREQLSNVTDSSDLHRPKLSLAQTTTEDGIKIDLNPLLQNAYSWIRSNRQPL